MEMREILVANTRTQRKTKITTDATTLGELKAVLDDAGVDYEGLTFTEGITKTRLLDDSSPLPTNVNYKGTVTNNLVMLLTNTEKKIDSGVGTRQEAYQIIRENDLMEGIKEEFGYNYTNVSTEDLWNYIDKVLSNEDTDEDTNDDVDIPDELSAISEQFDELLASIDTVDIDEEDKVLVIAGMIHDLSNLLLKDTDGTDEPMKLGNQEISQEELDNMIASV